jgi:glycosyltransferase involved in cell wall biosynthesis
MVKLSIVIPHLNYGRYLKRCLDSALAQTFKDYEIILVDGGSTDNTYEVLKDYPMVTVLKDVPPRGPVRATNKGIDIMKGEYFVQLNSDCYINPEMYQECVEILDKKPNVGMVYTSWYIIDDNDKQTGFANQPAKFDRNILLQYNYIDAAGLMLRKTCFDKVGKFDERCPMSMDWLMAAKVSRYFDVEFLNKPLFAYRVHSGQITQNPKLIEDNNRAKKIMRGYYGKDVLLKLDASTTYHKFRKALGGK